MDQSDSADDAWKRLPPVSYLVDRQVHEGLRSATPQGSAASGPSRSSQLTRTVAPHGLTGDEIERFSGAVQFMVNACKPPRSKLWWVTTNKGSSRAIIADLQKWVTRLQGKHRLLRYNATTFETRGGLHAHIAFIGKWEIADNLKSSTRFGETIHVAPVTNPDGLARKYLAKERTPQAGYGRERVLGGRLKGSHRLDGGGDRVRLSRDLEIDAIDAGYVQDWKHTNARRSAERKPYRQRRPTARKLTP